MIVEGRTTLGAEEEGGRMAIGVEELEVMLSIKGVLLSLLETLVGADEVVGSSIAGS